ncbi:CoA ester lyase [Pseudomonas putida]|jgi:(S)-citramalyl-CoA lyase|uniref:CoA ester lyase n=1 Tax=Pseudomonas putida TaxID=303 RepID=A0A1Y3LE99_PSEPU|nr:MULTISPECIES: CoA ester lyase [Pseudomonas]MBH1967238.1 CoA ester lyase [Pseudomonadales bacterium]MBH2077012.1 CoA ester lyase [Pseudomonadales bacterium]MBH3373525.1 CoA ester lyase [Pseudomonas juntendi]MBS6037147.1 CoA ester lyase [Pseudomonas sp.]MDY7072580.1 Citrate lyase subunit beta-like protein [Pseudomonas hunanensis]
MTSTIIRTALFVPATRLDCVSKAIATGADVVIVDLEDAVAQTQKTEARLNLQAFLEANLDVQVLVRINASGHPEHTAQLEMCQRLSNVKGIMLAKAETADQVRLVASSGKPVWPLLESALGLANIQAIAAVPNVERLTYGALDLGLDLGMANGTEAAERLIDQVRYAVILHSKLAGLAAPLDSVYPNFQDQEGFSRRVADIRDMGFGGLLCIHPQQVSVVHETLIPTVEELDWAKRVLSASALGEGVFVMDGNMVDAPVIARAKCVMQRAGNSN